MFFQLGVGLGRAGERVPIERDYMVQSWRKEHGLPDDRVLSLLCDRNGFLWVGTRKGVARFDGQRFLTWSRSNTEAFTSEECRCLAEGPDGVLWLGTGDGVVRLGEPPVHYSCQDIAFPIGPLMDPGTKAPILALIVTRSNQVVVAQGWCFFSLGADDQWRTWQRLLGAPLSLEESVDGVVWMGTTWQAYRLAPGSERIERTIPEPVNQEQTCVFSLCAVPGGEVYAVIGDMVEAEGRIHRWGAGGWELVSEERIKNWGSNPFLYADSGGALWYPLEGAGLVRRQGGQRVAYELPESFHGQTFPCLVEDREGNVWVGTDRDGLVCLQPRRVQMVTPEGGVAARNTWSLLESRDGALWAGVTRYEPGDDPERLPDVTNGPAVRVEGLVAGGRRLFQGVLAKVGGGSGSLVEVPARLRGAMQVEYSAAVFRAGDAVRYRYRLRGLSEEWVEAGTLREASYASVPPGDYRFEVEGVNKHGYWSGEPGWLEIRVEPFWHERTGVRAGLAAGVFLLVGGMVRWRMGEVKRLHRLEKQAARAEERIRLARDLHDSLGSDLTALTMLSNVGEQEVPTAEELAGRFNQLSRRTHEALHSLRDLIWMTHPRADSLEEVASRLCEHAGRMTRAAGVKLRLEVATEMPVVVVGPEVRRNLLLATSEAVHNAVRHGRPGCLRLRVGVEGRVFEVEVEDDGCGFDPGGVGLSGRVDRGMELEGMRERMTAARGECRISSRPGEGTTVRLRIPLDGA
ncbi:MAG: ATP-binding protein [Planctomycetes bacterium]|nr:ATP-binding protein [Planctomycetota bacterium]MCB9913186.1 ATP-binding protein [Planctomycetota bacterium]